MSKSGGQMMRVLSADVLLSLIKEGKERRFERQVGTDLIASELPKETIVLRGGLWFDEDGQSCTRLEFIVRDQPVIQDMDEPRYLNLPERVVPSNEFAALSQKWQRLTGDCLGKSMDLSTCMTRITWSYPGLPPIVTTVADWAKATEELLATQHKAIKALPGNGPRPTLATIQAAIHAKYAARNGQAN